ncbi:hypothetical protein SmJEL517_g02667 [Synchytrium microbalum]|uniref:Uncharacterized protein n=1 Tax=Synchytrium microbalum TaxID=1806994 RepID=A0A507C5I7_9FUNG|nr:uncharacterized protein SmJEL517_g02667 [Synchytrium microbalum]TPX34638.1 hypothetical protein SmJEL517_g02667 [Synchytrium microbalum]
MASSAPSFEDLVITIDGLVATIRINRPKSLNSFLLNTYKEIGKALHWIDTLNDVSITVITGTGKLFSSGIDLKDAGSRPSPPDPNDAKEERWRDISARGINTVIALAEHSKVTIVALNGAVVGCHKYRYLIVLFSLFRPAGWIAGADIIVASQSAYVYMPMIKFGLIPEAASSFTWATRLHAGFAEDLLYTARKATATELSPKAIQRVWPDKEFDAKLKEMIDGMRTQNVRSMLEAKRLLRGGEYRYRVQNAVVSETLMLMNRPPSNSSSTFANQIAEMAKKKQMASKI